MSNMIYNSIYASGYWYEGINEKKWSINYSSILTELIHMAGSYVDDWASDLFIIWNGCIEKHLLEKDWNGSTLYIGFREQGVDHYEEGAPINVLEKNKKESGIHYYRRIIKLETKITKDQIEMTLTQIQ